MTLLHKGRTLHIELRGADLVWMGLRATPDRDDMDTSMDVVRKWLVAQPHRVTLHVEDVAPPAAVAPLDLPCILCLVGKLLEHRDLVESRLRGACIQARTVDGPARAAHSLFLSVYALNAPIRLVEGPDEARRVLASLSCERV